LQKGEDMTLKQGDKEHVTTRGMLMDESATPARHKLVTPQELPPAEGDQFDSQFALLDEREHGDAAERAGGRRRAADKPLTPNETAPPKRT
jgi:hypothetical protein